MTTKGRYQTRKNKTTTPLKFSIIDTEGKTLGERFMAATDTEANADHIASALNFNYKPHEYGYEIIKE